MDDNLEKRLEAIERRLLAIESATFPSKAAPPVAPPVSTPAQERPAPIPAPPTPPVRPTPVVIPPESFPPRTVIEPIAAEPVKFTDDEGFDLHDEQELRWRAQLDKVAAHNPIDWAKLESLIGGKWLPLAGGLAVTIAVALFVKIAVDNGWLGLIPGWARCSLGGMLGIALLCAGEWARRRVNEWAAVGLTIAGLGSLYISSYAAYALYQLMPPPVTLAVLAGIMGIGVAISALTSLSVVGLVSLIGAYIAPFIASSGNTGYVYLPLYWGALLVVGQVLALTKGGTFAICRFFTTCGTLLLGAGWIMKFGAESPIIGLSMLGGTWLLCHIENAWTARRAELAGITEYSESDLSMILESEDFFSKAMRLRLRPLASVSLSAWASSLGVYLARESHAFAQSLTPGAIGGLAFVLACLLVGPGGILNPRPQSTRERLAAALSVTAGTLLVATIAIALSGFAQTIALTAIGLAALGAARWLRTQVLDIYSGLVLLFAAGRVLLYDSWATAPNAPGLEILGFYLTEWAGACAGVGVAWIVYSIVIALPGTPADADSPERTARFIPDHWLEIAKNVSLGIGIALLGASLFHQKTAHESIACAMIGTSLVFGLTAAFRRSSGLRVVSLAAITGATACTIGLSWWAQRSGAVEFAGFVLVPQMWVAFANGLSVLALAWILTEASWRSAQPARNFGLGIGIFFLGASVMHREAAHESIACAMIGTALVFGLTAAFRRSDGLRVASLAAIAGATACTIGLSWWVQRSNTVEIAGLVLVPQMWVALANGLAILAMAWILSEASWRWVQVAKVMSGFAVFLLVLGISHADSSATSICYAWLAICWTCLAFARVTKDLAFEFHSLLVWLAALATWVAKFGFNDWAGSGAPPLLHPGLWIAFALAGTLLAIQRISRPRLIGREAKAKALSWSTATVIVWVATSLEVARFSEMLPIDATARGAAVSVWWGLFAIILLVVGFWRNVPLVRRCGLGLLTIAASKALIFDLARVALGWRAVSVLCLGLLMLGVGIVYARIEKSLSSGATPPDKAEDESPSDSVKTV
ncbi:MAG: DUF2339 domain-containing protein [Phycisphaeraceae bacterium]|nr:DUF2339 domain-containing protein [Phycisphaeraceae bacterium]